MDKFQNKYRIASARLQGYDYGQNAAYFITICTKDRVHYFGEIDIGKMRLNAVGLLSEKYWLEIPKHFPFIKLENFVVMPNHVHGILIIDKTDSHTQKVDESKTGGVTGKNNPMLYGNISRIIRWYKGRCLFEIHKIQTGFQWQSRFHDHIIRNQKSFENIQNYIQNNPSNWGKDKFYGP